MKNIFIAGLPRSGTTLLSSILGTSSIVHYMGETVYLGNKKRICSCGNIDCSISNKYLERISLLPEAKDLYHSFGILDYLLEPIKQPSDDTIRIVPSNVTLSDIERISVNGVIGLKRIAKVFHEIFPEKLYFVESSKQIIFAEKLISDPDWIVILITRDIRGVAQSVLNSSLRKGVKRDIDQKLKVWLDFADRAQKMIESGIFHIQYEELCLNPDPIIEKINSKLSLSIRKNNLIWDPARHHFLFGNRNFFEKKAIDIKLDKFWEEDKSAEYEAILKKHFSNYAFMHTKYYSR